MGKEMVWCTS